MRNHRKFIFAIFLLAVGLFFLGWAVVLHVQIPENYFMGSIIGIFSAYFISLGTTLIWENGKDSAYGRSGNINNLKPYKDAVVEVLKVIPEIGGGFMIYYTVLRTPNRGILMVHLEEDYTDKKGLKVRVRKGKVTLDEFSI
ncbi:hypothetical protein COB64_01315 [Candidatus Wolfebacteria bacterium]|nr:MAG: hypothetical protein COB64_01315 [Candidatus Wolfebacteria bacterium]